MEIKWEDARDIHIGPWASVYMLKPDRMVLERSLADYGWIQPIMIQHGSNSIIDGNVRFQVALADVQLMKSNKGKVPTISYKCDNIDAMLMHLRLNRARGNVVAKKMSTLIRDIVRSRKYDEKELKKLLVMKGDEMDLMMDGSLIKMRKIDQHEYSRAWVPVEAPASFTETSSVIERPPNPDR